MTVEDKRGGSLTNEDSAIDKFPIGMRVLAVDDDPICLKVLETLLRKCQYQVTITNQAVTALRMLRENRNKYDLVISDVNMPDMDGFKLLELVGLEMDLPVIMLSAHSDTKLVMKGITHGAYDYLLKPVRIEELKNIWQHVIRRKKINPEDQNKTSSNQENDRDGAGESGQGATSTGNSDQNGISNRKRKDQNEDEDEEGEDDGQENEDSTSQKKPRVVWSVELHRKFVAAVNQLGLDKAVPKKILDLMNVEGLTRENVASHLQKYRLYLKRISNVTTQQACMVAALGTKDSAYLRMGSLDGFGDFHSLNSPGRLSNTAPGNMLGRLNSIAGLTIRGIASSGMIQPGHSQTLNNSFNMLGKVQQAMLPANQNVNLFLPQAKSTAYIGDFNHTSDQTPFTALTSFTDARMPLGSSSSCTSSALSNHSILQANPQQAQSRGAFGNQSSLNAASFNLDIGVHGSSNFLDHSRCDESWQGAVQLSKIPSNSLPLIESFSHHQVPPNNLSCFVSSTSCHIANNPLDISTSIATSTPLEDSREDMLCQAGLIDNVIQIATSTPLEDSREDMLCQAGLIDNVIQNLNYTSKQQWEEHSQDYNQNLNHPFISVDSLVSGNCTMGPFSQSVDQSNTPYIVQHTGVEKPSLDTKLRSNDAYILEQSKSQDGFIQNNFDSLDDIMSAMAKRDQNETILMDGELGFDAYCLGSCI